MQMQVLSLVCIRDMWEQRSNFSVTRAKTRNYDVLQAVKAEMPLRG